MTAKAMAPSTELRELKAIADRASEVLELAEKVCFETEKLVALAVGEENATPTPEDEPVAPGIYGSIHRSLDGLHLKLIHISKQLARL